MPKVDLTITISVVIAICAIISPIITTLLNNRHLYKMRKLDMQLENEKATSFYKRGIFEEYLKVTGRCISHADATRLNEYGEIYPIALLYFPEELRNDLIEINDFVNNYSWKEARHCLNQLTIKICTILQTM